MIFDVRPMPMPLRGMGMGVHQRCKTEEMEWFLFCLQASTTLLYLRASLKSKISKAQKM